MAPDLDESLAELDHGLVVMFADDPLVSEYLDELQFALQVCGAGDVRGAGLPFFGDCDCSHGLLLVVGSWPYDVDCALCFASGFAVIYDRIMSDSHIKLKFDPAFFG